MNFAVLALCALGPFLVGVDHVFVVAGRPVKLHAALSSRAELHVFHQFGEELADVLAEPHILARPETVPVLYLLAIDGQNRFFLDRVIFEFDICVHARKPFCDFNDLKQFPKFGIII
jgi:hypothetical protein